MDLEQKEVNLMELQVQQLSFSYGKKRVITDCSFSLAAGELTVITGPNGSGKSTLVHLLGGALTPDSGKITIDGRRLAEFDHLERSCTVGVLMQEKMPALDFTVRERVMMGRFASLPRIFAPGADECRRTDEILEVLGMSSFAQTPCNRLSGGEYQKVLIASLLVRETPVMLLDEPTSALDPAGALEVMALLQKKKKECAIAVVTHDLTLASLFADKLLLVSNGGIWAAGVPEKVLTAENIAAVYKCDSEILPSSAGPVPVFRR